MGTSMSLQELRRRETPDGKLAELIDVISEENRVLEYMTWIEANNGFYHEDTRVATEPTGNNRALDEGVVKEAGVTEPITERTMELASISEVDDKKYRASPNPDGFRLQEDGLFLKGMTKTLVGDFFDGNRGTDPREIDGINNRSDYNTLSSDYTYDNADGNASSTANKTSVYFFQFGHKKLNMIYPRNNPMGGGTLPIKMEDFGKSIINQSGTSETKKYPAWQTWFSADFGIFIHDPRCIKRIVNISTSNIDGVDDFAWHEDSMIDASGDLEYNGEGTVICVNRTLLAQARKRANEKGNAFYTQTVVEGPFARPVLFWDGIPIVRVDQITNTQATIT
jgi:hypothetical protein